MPTIAEQTALTTKAPTQTRSVLTSASSAALLVRPGRVEPAPDDRQVQHDRDDDREHRPEHDHWADA